VVDGLGDAGLVVTDVMRSPLSGADGNVEFLAAASRAGVPVTTATLDAVAPPDAGGAA
jgi:hypothetical protein